MGFDRFAFAATDRIGKAIAGPSAISNELSRPACDKQRPGAAPVRCVECRPSGRCREFPGKPADRPRFERIRCNDADLDVIAFRAFEQPVLETGRSRRNPFQHHPRLAAGTARAFNGGQELMG